MIWITGEMSKIFSTKNLMINGPSGAIEAILEKKDDVNLLGVIIICHPHPLFGGTMQNKVVHTISRACLHKNLMVLKFNFRGVGKSQGAFDDGIGELDDAIHMINYVQIHYPKMPIWIGGFSFGAGIAIQAASIKAPIGLISVAPSLSNPAMFIKNEPQCPWLIVHGAQDELIDINVIESWCKGLQVLPEIIILEEATHFFHGCLIDLRIKIESFIKLNIKK
jgi:hypothetical protein